MILVCTQCKASYLVPASVFANGPRQVRCARCSHTWQADLPSKMTVMPTEASETLKPASPPSSNSSSSTPLQSEPPKKKVDRTVGAAAEPELPVEQTVAPPPVATMPIPEGSNLPALLHNPKWRRARVATAVVVILILVVGVLGGMGAKAWIVDKLWPKIEHLIEKISFASPVTGSGFSLQQIHSERRYEDGGMQLVVDGEIRNDGAETRPVPDIQVKALGPDRKVIQDWRIEAPVATLATGASAPFHSSIVPPQGTVAEVNLNFVEPHHD